MVTIYEVMEEQRIKGVHRIEVRNNMGQPSIATQEIRYEKIKVCPPIGKEKRYGNLELTVGQASRLSIDSKSRRSWIFRCFAPTTGGTPVPPAMKQPQAAD